ncbi:MAG: hypothetical protein ACK4PR_04215 [Gammaproteobacteria bacterium]
MQLHTKYTPTLGVILIGLISLIWLGGVAYSNPYGETTQNKQSSSLIASIADTPILYE